MPEQRKCIIFADVMSTWRLTSAIREKLKNDLNAEIPFRLSDSVLEELISFGTPVRLSRGKSIITAGEVQEDVYIIVDGIMRTWHLDGDREVTQAFGTPPTLVLSYHSYCAGMPSNINFEACTPMKLLRISRRDYDSLLEHSREFALWTLRQAQHQLYFYERRQGAPATAAERYKTLLKHIPDIIPQVPMRMIASYLGITPDYLSRLRRSML